MGNVNGFLHRGAGEFGQTFLKNSNARVVAWGGDVEASI